MIEIIKSGLLTTIQDTGRYGYQKDGIIVSGAMDQVAHRAANMLVGNDQNEATIEMTMLGPEILFHEDVLLAICGGDLSPTINGKKVGNWRPILVKKGSSLVFGSLKTGARSYLAVAGGIEVTPVLGSKSTYLRAALGGYQGRALDAEDKLSIGSPEEISREMTRRLEPRAIDNGFSEMSWNVERTFSGYYMEKSAIRVIKGKEFDLFTEKSRQKLLESPFRISPKSDRMGYRLQGDELSLRQPAELLSEAVTDGTIQVPADGNPIILMADRQTVGGYPKIAQVAAVDIPAVAQMRPGNELYFQEVSLQQAQILFIQLESKLAMVKKSIHLKVR